MQNGWSVTHAWHFLIGRDILALEISCEEQGGPSPISVPSDQASSARKRIPNNFGL